MVRAIGSLVKISGLSCIFGDGIWWDAIFYVVIV